MKKTILFFILICMGSIVVWSCTKVEKPASTDFTEINEAMLKDTISNAIFLDWTNRWNSNSKGFMDTAKITYITMPIIDLDEFLGEKATSARFYIGLDSLAPGKYNSHLILTGADKKGILRGKNTYHKFDITKTCPPDCDDN